MSNANILQKGIVLYFLYLSSTSPNRNRTAILFFRFVTFSWGLELPANILTQYVAYFSVHQLFIYQYFNCSLLLKLV